jgi:hypothetical protein
MDVGAVKAPTIRRSQIMQAITTIGLDIAKSVFQVHGVDAEGHVVIVHTWFGRVIAIPRSRYG